jgi:hypothetical protein
MKFKAWLNEKEYFKKSLMLKNSKGEEQKVTFKAIGKKMSSLIKIYINDKPVDGEHKGIKAAKKYAIKELG